MKSVKRQKKRKPGRPATGRDPLVSARIPKETLVAIDRAAKKKGISRSVAVREMLDALRDDHDYKLKIETLPDCLVQLSIGPSCVEFRSNEMGRIAAGLLHAAQTSYAASGKELPDITKRRPPELVVLSASVLGLSPSQKPNHVSLVVQFGDAVLSIPIEKNKLRQLGQALVALSAPTDQSH